MIKQGLLTGFANYFASKEAAEWNCGQMEKRLFQRKLTDGVYAIALRCRKEGAERPYRLTVLPTLRYWYADPVVTEIQGKQYLFAEAYDRFLNRGFLAAFELEISGDRIACSKPRKVIEEDFHLSFPLVFRHEDQYYLMPESCADNSLRFYRMGDTPFDWQLVRRIPMEDSVDTVVIRAEEGDYFLNTQEHPTEKLWGRQKLYFAKDFLKDELEDVSHLLEDTGYQLTKRNGGPVYSEGGCRFRVGQNCTEDFYGKSFSLYRILELSDKAYREELLCTTEAEELPLEPYPAQYELTGTHTYSRTDQVEAVDVSCRYCSLKNIFAKFIRKFT